MKKLIMTAAVAALVATPAFGQSLRGATPERGAMGAGNNPTGNAATPRGTDPFTARAQAGGPGVGGRDAVLRDCAGVSRPYSESAWGTLQMQAWRSCMAEHGQPE
jgi:hypothetical protein